MRAIRDPIELIPAIDAACEDDGLVLRVQAMNDLFRQFEATGGWDHKESWPRAEQISEAWIRLKEGK